MTYQQPDDKRNTFGAPMSVLGWLCVAAIACLLVEMTAALPFVPEAWWTSPGAVVSPPGRFDLRMMWIDPGPLGWTGAWGYLAALVWIPVAVWRVVCSKRSGINLRPGERVLLALVPTLVLVVQALLRLTPLKYGYPLI